MEWSSGRFPMWHRQGWYKEPSMDLGYWVPCMGAIPHVQHKTMHVQLGNAPSLLSYDIWALTYEEQPVRWAVTGPLACRPVRYTNIVHPCRVTVGVEGAAEDCHLMSSSTCMRAINHTFMVVANNGVKP